MDNGSSVVFVAAKLANLLLRFVTPYALWSFIFKKITHKKHLEDQLVNIKDNTMMIYSRLQTWKKLNEMMNYP